MGRMAIVVGCTIRLVADSALAVEIETVLVGNTGNAGELSSPGPGGEAPDRICGFVDYTYNIGKYEVTAGQYAEFLNKVAGVDIYGLYNTGMANTAYGSGITRSGTGTADDPYTYSVASSHINRPVNYVSYWDACRFANWLHNNQPTGAQGAGTTETGAYTLNSYNGYHGGTIQRNVGWKWAVTSEDEWYKAAYHKNDGVTGNYWDYPTSSNSSPGRDLNDVSGNNANTGGPIIQSPYYTTVVGEFQNSESPYSTFDQGGNVWEWNESIVYQDSTHASRGVRGGSFNRGSGALRASWRDHYSPMGEDNHIGFRVSNTTEPAPAVTLVSALSRKQHPLTGGIVGDVDVLGGNVECRFGGLSTLVLGFDGPVRSTGLSETDCTNFTLSRGSCVSVNMSGTETVAVVIADEPADGCVTVGIQNLESSYGGPFAGPSELHVRTLLGDHNSDGVVNIVDLNEVKRSLFQPTPDSFRSDINVDGVISIADLNAVKGNLFSHPECP